MKIIAFEGLDKSGKATQSHLLTEYLHTLGCNVRHSEFHRYDTPTGKLIQDWLYGRYDVDQKTIELIMTADKQAQQQWFKELQSQGVDYLILDRYTSSQKVYSICNQIDPEWTEELQRYMWLPDAEVFIDIPVEESMKRKGKHGDNDRYESDKDLLTRIRAQFIHHFKTEEPLVDKVIINGMKPVEDIHTDIIKRLTQILLV